MSTVYSRVAGHGSLFIGHMLKTGTSIAPSHAATINVPLSGLLVALQNAAVAAGGIGGEGGGGVGEGGGHGDGGTGGGGVGLGGGGLGSTIRKTYELV
ncbi:hypothetical protein CYMTET_6227 [Cymbomonas tetramitiformis]|uniref:Uncharacterized protein n=1 Tax=Cymbomonas tetramitiformis TaxID=36881 RepID=A0AAE0LIM3_9CHLO|nr:hypothetical protein CYMTET_24520 [Cymbomonas tetramitiformis]KAK3286205.1 hypothetical protein CYMTET_6227 [Cymbomonas tetramitiformis]